MIAKSNRDRMNKLKINIEFLEEIIISFRESGISDNDVAMVLVKNKLKTLKCAKRYVKEMISQGEE